MRGSHLYETTSTGGADYVTSSVDGSCGAYFTRAGGLYRLDRSGGYSLLVTGATLADPPFIMVDDALFVDSGGTATKIADQVASIRHPYYLTQSQVLYRWHQGASERITEGVTHLGRTGFLKGSEGYALNGSRFRLLSRGVTTIAAPYYLKGNSLYLNEDGQEDWVASAVSSVTERGYFLRSGNLYQIEQGGTYGLLMTGVDSIAGNLAYRGDEVWQLNGDVATPLSRGAQQSSRQYYLEGGDLYEITTQGSEYLGTGVTQLPCSGGLPFYLD